MRKISSSDDENNCDHSPRSRRYRLAAENAKLEKKGKRYGRLILLAAIVCLFIAGFLSRHPRNPDRRPDISISATDSVSNSATGASVSSSNSPKSTQ